jgi:hypothetical protein
VEELRRRDAESPLDWLGRLQSLDVSTWTVAQKRVRSAYLADARRLLEEDQQRVKWKRAQQ